MLKKVTFLSLLLILITGTRILAKCPLNPEVIAGGTGTAAGIALHMTGKNGTAKKYVAYPAEQLGINLSDYKVIGGLLLGLGLKDYLAGTKDNCKAIQHTLIGAGTFHVLKSEFAKQVLSKIPFLNSLLVCPELECKGVCSKCAATKYGLSAVSIYAGEKFLQHIKKQSTE